MGAGRASGLARSSSSSLLGTSPSRRSTGSAMQPHSRSIGVTTRHLLRDGRRLAQPGAGRVRRLGPGLPRAIRRARAVHLRRVPTREQEQRKPLRDLRPASRHGRQPRADPTDYPRVGGVERNLEQGRPRDHERRSVGAAREHQTGRVRLPARRQRPGKSAVGRAARPDVGQVEPRGAATRRRRRCGPPCHRLTRPAGTCEVTPTIRTIRSTSRYTPLALNTWPHAPDALRGAHEPAVLRHPVSNHVTPRRTVCVCHSCATLHDAWRRRRSRPLGRPDGTACK